MTANWIVSKGVLEKSAFGITIVQLAREVFHTQAARINKNLTGARTGRDPEHVHDIRVATRRARFALRLMVEYLEPDMRIETAKSLKEVAQTLGAVRDCDVLLEMSIGYLKLFHTTDDYIEDFRAMLESERKPARTALRRILAVKSIGPIVSALRIVADDVYAGATSDPNETARSVAPRFINSACDYIGEMYSALPEFPEDEQLHELRIAFKRLRYTCEYFSQLYPPEFEELIDACIKYQDCLGLHQDAVVGRTRLFELLRQPRWSHLHPNYATGLLNDHLQNLADFKRLEFENTQDGIPELLSQIRSKAQL